MHVFISFNAFIYLMVLVQMSFISKGSIGNRGGQGRRPNVIWQEGMNIEVHFSIIFDTNSCEFNKLFQKKSFKPWWTSNLASSIFPSKCPLWPHPIIMDVPEKQP